MSIADIPLCPLPGANVSQVPQRSPLRYPGGKTWLVPHVRAWLRETEPPLLLEPFAGGGSVSLTAVMEGLAARALMVEIDRDVAAFWHAALRHGDMLRGRVLAFHMSDAAVRMRADERPDDIVARGFRTLLLNRTRRGGILAPGASFQRSGENGQGIGSRWYPGTLVQRLKDISAIADRLSFCEGDGLELMETFLRSARNDVAVFIDPPYTAGAGKQAGRRLYAHNELDHERLFRILADASMDFLMTYDMSGEILALTRRFGFHAMRVEMRNTHHAQMGELIISRRRLPFGPKP